MLSGISLSRVGIILKFLNSGTWKDQEPHNECQQKTTKQGKIIIEKHQRIKEKHSIQANTLKISLKITWQTGQPAC